LGEGIYTSYNDLFGLNSRCLPTCQYVLGFLTEDLQFFPLFVDFGINIISKRWFLWLVDSQVLPVELLLLGSAKLWLSLLIFMVESLASSDPL